MEIRELARAVLFGDRLENKLLGVAGSSRSALTDDAPGPALAQPPSAPGRPARLRLDNGRSRARFPRDAQLVHAEARGHALHFFANHELLAMELMALVLLRFPAAPAGFRRGVAHTLIEEQDHLHRYRARMAELGVELGDVPVSDFFWATMADMETPLDYVVRMSLTFEQANLDHAMHYASLFRAVEDEDTARLMDLVYEEEIGHVQHGVTWFNRWRHDDAPSPDETDWQAYNRLLPAPLSARRARGQPYVFDARHRVGLSDTFARELEVFSQSRGRPPVAWVFEPDFEAQLAGATPSPISRALAADLAPVMMFLAASDDVVVTPVRPRGSMLTALTRAGFEVPELCVSTADEASVALAGRPLTGVAGWGQTRAMRALRAAARAGPSPAVEPCTASKIWAAEVLEQLVAAEPEWRGLMGPRTVIGRACASLTEVAEAVEAIAQDGFREVLIKRPFSSSGQARLRISVDADLGSPWLERALGASAVLVEPWLDNQADLSVLLDVTDADLDAPRALRVQSMRFMTGRGGVYRGHLLAEPTVGLSPSLHRRLAFGSAGGLAARFARLGRFVRHRLARAGHRGPAAIDAMVYRPPGAAPEARLKPIVEINARRTMGHVAQALRQHLAPGRFGVWLHRPRQPTDADRVAKWSPIETRLVGRRRQLVRGLLATTDPAVTDRVWTLLAVGDDLDEVRALVAEHLDERAARPLAQLTGR